MSGRDAEALGYASKSVPRAALDAEVEQVLAKLRKLGRAVLAKTKQVYEKSIWMDFDDSIEWEIAKLWELSRETCDDWIRTALASFQRREYKPGTQSYQLTKDVCTGRAVLEPMETTLQALIEDDSTLRGMLHRTAYWHPQHEAVVDDGLRLSYAELADYAQRMATLLHARGVRKGDRVALLTYPSVTMRLRQRPIQFRRTLIPIFGRHFSMHFITTASSSARNFKLGRRAPGGSSK